MAKPKIKRTVFKSKSWLQRTAKSTSQRSIIASMLKTHRRTHYLLYTYTRNRRLEELQRMGFDFGKWIGERLARQDKLNVLHSGSGFMVLDADLKKAFGDKIFVTSLNVLRPKLTGKMRQELLAEINAEENPGKRQQMLKTLEQINESEKNVKIVDEFRVSPLEKFSARRQYDAILDLAGPYDYSADKPRVLERYLSILKPGGSLFLLAMPTGEIALSKLKPLFGPKGKIAEMTGHYFTVESLPNTVFWELKKHPVRK